MIIDHVTPISPKISNARFRHPISTDYKHKLFLFAKNDEYCNLAWPFIILGVLGYLQIAFGQLSPESANIFLFGTGFFLLNAVHSVFFVFVLFLFPESRIWLKSMPMQRSRLLMVRWGSVFLSLILFFFLLGSIKRNSPAYIFFSIILIMKFVAQSHHTIFQIRGFATAYNRLIEANSDLDSRILQTLKKRERIEKFLFTSLMWCYGLALVLLLAGITQFKPYLFVVCALLVIALFANHSRFPGSNRTLKGIYLLRLIFYPLGVLSPIFAVGIPCFHGVEYTFLFRKMWGKSKIDNSLRGFYLWSIVLPISFLVGIATIARMERGFGSYLYKLFPDHIPWVAGIAALSLALNYFHFYMDGQIFRMRDPTIRKFTGALLS